ncbi:hypothetical protein K503DRAFT_200298 [Rhizopogon vinicolor AM-OR11-026]|uniref:Uncharacterized protein n=1 Tax=Rhizopogon vinicolor AM-OR11-026 TaxID=1314800 RepID=A0A1B7NED6_9AGAM|nr:hypothetical protein K503DRAFT_200298 [Rhizopogon vinicolor AM-OR11-026]
MVNSPAQTIFIDDAREKLAKMEMEIELQELARQGREAEQKLAKMRAAVASFPAGPSRSASDSNYYPHPSYQEVPLTARIEEEVQDLPSNVQSSRPSAQVPLTYHDYQRNYPPPSWSSSSLHRRPSTHGRGHTFAVPNYQHSTPSSTPSYTYQKMSQTRQSHQQLGEEYWAQQSQKYMAELAAAGTRPQGETSSAGVNPQATLPSGTAIPQHAQRQTPLPAAPSEVAPAIPSTQRPASSSQVRPSLTGATLLSARPQQARVQHQTILSPVPSEAAPTVPSIQRPPSSSEQKFIRSFQTVCGHNAVLIRAFLSTYPVSVEWLTEAVSSIDPAKLKDASAVALLNEMRKHFKVSPPQSTSTSTSTNVCVPVVEDPSKASTTTIQPSPSPTDSSSIQQPTSLDTKEKYMVCFHEIYRRAGMDKATDFFLRNQPRVPQEWQQALVNSLTPELSAEMHAAWNRAHRRPGEAHLASSGAAGGSDASSNNIPNNVTQQNRSQTTSPNLNEVVTQSAPTTTDLPNLIPVPPRPSVTRSTQVQSMSAQPSQTSTAPHRTTTTMFAASATQSTSAPAARVSAPTAQVSASTTQKAPLAPLTQPTAFTTRQQEPLTRFVAYQHATANQYRPYNIPPPMSVPTVDGKHVYYVQYHQTLQH